MLKYNPPRYLFRRHTIVHNLNRGKLFLEVGAGNLKLSQELANFYDSGTSIDFSDSVKEIYMQLPEIAKSRINIVVGDFLKHDFNKKYDCIVSCEVLEHVKEDTKFLKKMNELLKKNGQLIVSVPAKDKYWTIHDDVVGHLRRYSKEQLITVLKENGFKEIKVYSYGFPFINILWILRALHGKKQYSTKSQWSKKKQTKESGIGQIPSKYNFLAIFINKYTFYIPNKISSLFDNFDLSEGYIAIAKK